MSFTTVDLLTLGLSAGNHDIQVKAKSSTLPASPLTPSGEIEFNPKLATPTISLSGDILTITNVLNATNYGIYVDSTLNTSILAVSGTETTLDLSTLGLTSGTHTVQVQATHTGWTSSDLSESVTYVAGGLPYPTSGIYRNGTLAMTWAEIKTAIPDAFTTQGKLSGIEWTASYFDSIVQSGDKLVIDPEISTIGIYALFLSSATIEVVLPSTITNIETLAFKGSRLTSLTCYANVPPTIDSQTFRFGMSNPIYVPSGSVTAYQNANNWSQYASVIQAIPE